MAGARLDARVPSRVQASPSFTATLARVRATLQRTADDEAQLCNVAWPQILSKLHAALETGKPITGAGQGRGLPLDVVVATLKASWHVDGTWPIGPNAKQMLEQQAQQRAQAEKGPEAKQDPGPDDIARAYRARGVHVDEPAYVDDDDWRASGQELPTLSDLDRKSE
ncbi:hypothetical protein L1887_54158 [Cichorium endivia]|nr:hypothetical protein L1887_54158 [Cichorium endivia]